MSANYERAQSESKKVIELFRGEQSASIPQNNLRGDKKPTITEKSSFEKISAEDTIPEHNEVIFVEEKVFPILLPAVKNCLLAAKSLNCLKLEKHIFNGIDFISQLLYNSNPRYPERKIKNENIFDMEWVKKILEEKKRPLYPLSHLWKEEKAAITIQAFMRGYFVRRDPEVQDLRQFWKSLKKDKLEKELEEQAKLEAEAALRRPDSIINLI